jgi:hypothetical protein
VEKLHGLRELAPPDVAHHKHLPNQQFGDFRCLFDAATACSLLVFFALAMQCWPPWP